MDGTVIADRYELHERLGAGGMGEVYRARDLALQRDVAVKILPAHLVGDAAAERRFRREARAAAALVHPNVVAVHDAVVDGPVHAIVMELVEGPALGDLARRGISVEQAMALVRDAAAGLQAAHEHGFVHRDVKPGNVLVTPDGVAKIADFGIVRVTDASQTMTAAISGSVPYVAPEQLRGEDVDARTDLYGLGCVLFELLTGRPPFQAPEPLGVVHHHLHTPPPDPRSLRPEVPPALAALTMQLLAKDPADRPATAAEVVAALSGTATATAVLPPSATTTVVAAPPRRRSPGPLTVAVLVVGGLLVLAVIAAALWPDDDPAAAADPGPVTPTTPVASPTPTETTPPEPEPPATVDDAVVALRRTIAEQRAAGEMSDKAVRDLEERLAKIIETLQSDDDDDDDDKKDRGKAQASSIEEFDKTLEELEKRGDVTPTAAIELRVAMAQLAELL